jgi:limonene-1,2-epoxide hydrolase
MSKILAASTGMVRCTSNRSVMQSSCQNQEDNVVLTPEPILRAQALWTVVAARATIIAMTDNKRIVQRFWDGLAARDWEAMKALLTDDAHYTDVGIPGPGGIGPEGVIRRLKIGIEPLEGYDHLPGTNMIGEGNLVMTEHTERWTFHTGEVIDHSFVSVTELEDGKIRRWHDYSNISNITDNAPQWWLEHIMNATPSE